MIQVRFFENNTGFEIAGHALFAAHGSDIVCSAVSSAAIMAANTLTEVFGEKALVDVQDGLLVFKGTESKQTQGIIAGLRLHLEQLAEQYPQNITIS